MHIIPLEKTFENILKDYSQEIEKLLIPYDLKGSAFNLVSLLESTNQAAIKMARHLFLQALRKLDYDFKNQIGRSKRYYIKHQRERTIITTIGVITYRRCEYISRYNNKPYCHVDKYLGIGKRQRYGNDICALVYERYADSNSMIKVGKEIGLRISGLLLSKNRYNYQIPRQTIHNILNRIKPIEPLIERVKETPSVLYIMADEKYLSLQQRKNHHKNKVEVKLVVIFEGKEKVTTKASQTKVYKPNKRFKYLNKYYFTSIKPNIFEDILNVIDHRYDVTKIKKIILMGDGAKWIKAGVPILKSESIDCEFHLDLFHCLQALNRIFKDKDYYQMAYNYLINDAKEDLFKLIDIYLTNNPHLTEVITNNRNYLNNNYDYAIKMIKENIVGCAMEQAISHALASPFSSVAKAYNINSLDRYIKARVSLLNDYDLTYTYLMATMHSKNDSSESIKLTDNTHDYSIFDRSSDKSEYPININDFNRNNIYRF